MAEPNKSTAQLKAEAEQLLAQAALAEAQQALAQVQAYDGSEAQQLRAAVHAQSVAAANAATIGEGAKAIQTLIPDLSKVSRGESEFGGTPLFAGILTDRSLRDAAAKVAEEVKTKLGSKGAVLVLSHGDLVAVDASYLAVKSGLSQLKAQLRGALSLNLPEPATEIRDGSADGDAVKSDVDALELKRVAVVLSLPSDRLLASTLSRGAASPEAMASPVAAVASAIVSPVAAVVSAIVPPVLSVLTADRSVVASATSLASGAAVASLAGALLDDGKRVVSDDFRTVNANSGLHTEEREVWQGRCDLVEKLDGIQPALAVARDHVADMQARIDVSAAALGGGKVDDAKQDDLKAEAAAWMEKRDGARAQEAAVILVVERIRATIDAVDLFLAAIRTVPEGSTRSPLVAAILNSQLHDSEPKIPYVAYVSGTVGSVDQLVEDRPFLWKDRYEAVGSVSLTYSVLDVAANRLVAAGVCTGTSRLHGKIGSRFELSSLGD